ncbi:MAG: hypothetical protein JWN01_218 [Patescibacteria group bacterium]|nr:hypothetical protein [Patescibacteria group bacterium]
MSISARDVVKILSIITLFAGGLLVAFLVRRELAWIGTAFFLAIALNPPVARLMRVMPRRSRLLATTSVFLGLMVALVFLVAVLVPPLVKQSEQLAANFPKYMNELTHGHSFISEGVRQLNLARRIQEGQDQVLRYASSAGGSFFTIVKDVFSSFAAGLTVLGLTFFMLLEGPVWMEAFWRLVPADRRKHGRRLVDQMYEAVTGYVTGNMLTSFLAAATTIVALSILGVPYAIPLGIVVGLFDLLPMVGASLGAAVVIIISFFTSMAAAVVMVVFFVIYQQLENHVLQPIVYGRTVRMSPLLVLVSVLIGAGLGGILGALVAIPLGASLQIVVRDLAARRLGPS